MFRIYKNQTVSVYLHFSVELYLYDLSEMLCRSSNLRPFSNNKHIRTQFHIFRITGIT